MSPIPTSIPEVIFRSINMGVDSVAVSQGDEVVLLALRSQPEEAAKKRILVSLSIGETTGGEDIFLVSFWINPTLDTPVTWADTGTRMETAIGDGTQLRTGGGVLAHSLYVSGTRQGVNVVGVDLSTFAPNVNEVYMTVQTASVGGQSFLASLGWGEFA